VTTTSRCCDDIAMHCHSGVTYRAGRPVDLRFGFQWTRPRAAVIHLAERHRFRIALNRYPGVVIGVAIQVGTRALSILWGRPGKPIWVPLGSPDQAKHRDPDASRGVAQ
jgi:hypothetical protein